MRAAAPGMKIEDLPSAVPAIEAVFAELLAEVLRVDRVSADSHFFGELGADSLVMAHFCARVRKCGNLPSVSMRDVYQYPTVRSLATALASAASGVAAPPAPAAIEAQAQIGPRIEPRIEARKETGTSAREYFVCGALQALFFLAYTYVVMLGAETGYTWIEAGSNVVDLYVRLVLVTTTAFLAASAIPIAAKWALVGRWEARQIRLWSLDYVRFWIVKTLVRSSPAAHLFNGTPLYSLYLRALGAKIGPRVLIFSRHVPVCTDLLTIDAGTVIRAEALFNGYRAQAGQIETGPVTLGRDTFVGVRSVLDINTSMGDGAQLGHASALQSGQTVPAGERWHGSPAQRTDLAYLRVPAARVGNLRRTAYSAAALSVVLLLYLPLAAVVASLAISAASSLTEVLVPSAGASILQAVVAEAAILSLIVFFGLVLGGLVLTISAPRVLNAFLRPDTVYPLFGFHDLARRAIARLGSVKFFTFLFGDSSYIVHYLQWLGYQLRPLVQTGSNFGIEVVHTNPLLCSVGSGTMVADGLMMINEEISSTSFRLSQTAIGPNSFLGNDVTYPAGGRTGDNVLLGTKVMVPLEGKVHEGVGLLGAPSFEIPRTVERDSQFDHLHTGEALRKGLAAKNRYNLRTIGVFLLAQWLGVFLAAMFSIAAFELYDVLPHAPMAVLLAASLVVPAVYFALVQRWLQVLHPLRPAICSIYHPDFWRVERLWKVHPPHLFHVFNGTPFKNVLWRLMGVRIGKRIFDDGAHISEPTLTAVGDESILNYRSKIQCHSQEDGTFKCDRTAIGARCTIGVGALVHYGVTMGDGAALATESFLMKGEEIPPGARWSGNPATAVATGSAGYSPTRAFSAREK